MGKLYLGVDPGVNGGLACLTVEEGQLFPDAKVELLGMPVNMHDAWMWLFERRHAVMAVLEKVGGYVGGGQAGAKTHDTGSSMFTFGQSAGILQGFLIAAGIPFKLVHPATWQSKLGLYRKKKGPDKKKELRRCAELLFPHVKMTNQTCDALLLAHYCHENREELS